MVRRRLVPSRAEAQRLIETRRVLVTGVPTPKPATLVTTDTPIRVAGEEPRWVSRGAHKLQAALDVFGFDVTGKRALDVGASTGGFTQVLLERGARSVVALDVGRAQLHEVLREDPRVVVVERVNFRHVDPADLGGPFPLIVADLSFISLCTVAEKLSAAIAPGGDLVVLVKPQFEAGPAEVGRGGVVRSAAVRAATVAKVVACLLAVDLAAQGLIRSPIEGADGNVEYLLWLRHGETPVSVEVPE